MSRSRVPRHASANIWEIAGSYQTARCVKCLAGERFRWITGTDGKLSLQKPVSQVRILPGASLPGAHSNQRKRWFTHRPTYPLRIRLAHLRTAADSLAENRTQIVGLSVDLAANT